MLDDGFWRTKKRSLNQKTIHKVEYEKEQIENEHLERYESKATGDDNYKQTGKWGFEKTTKHKGSGD